jgi:hypothetical protein
LSIMSILNERQIRLYAAERALELGWGGVMLLTRISGLSERTSRRGIQELQSADIAPGDFARSAGGGRKRLEEAAPALVAALEALMGETTAGDPMRVLKWTTQSTRALAVALTRQGHAVSHTSVARLLQSLDYSLRGNTKSLEGKQHPSRDAQFRYIHQEVKRCLRAKIPVISVDTKKKEKVGSFKNPGLRWRKIERLVNTYDFPSLAEGTAIHYGVYDLAENQGFVNVGMSHDTAEFAVESIERWWRMLGRRWYPQADRLLITADGGGSNGSRNRLWKYSLQQFADRHELNVTVCHYPPGTSKWNKVEHRMFSHISITWRGEPLTTYETVLEFINATTTKSGLQIKAKLDEYEYETRKKVSEEQMGQVHVQPHKTHPAWNYTIQRKYHKIK